MTALEYHYCEHPYRTRSQDIFYDGENWWLDPDDYFWHKIVFCPWCGLKLE